MEAQWDEHVRFSFNQTNQIKSKYMNKHSLSSSRIVTGQLSQLHTLPCSLRYRHFHVKNLHVSFNACCLTAESGWRRAPGGGRGITLTSGRRESTCLAGKIHPTAAVARFLICPQLSRRASQCTTLLLSPRKLDSSHDRVTT